MTLENEILVEEVSLDFGMGCEDEGVWIGNFENSPILSCLLVRL